MDDDKAFDAVESYLCDSTQGLRSRKTVSLIVALRGILRHGPQFTQPSPEARGEVLVATAEEITRRGIDTASLVRYGMFREIAGGLAARLLLSFLPSGEPLVPDSIMAGYDMDGWLRILPLKWEGNDEPDLSVPELFDFAVKFLGPVVSLIEKWVLTAPLNDLLLLKPPSSIDALPTFDDPMTDEMRHQYEWAVDHFTETFYHDWQTESLYRAYRWIFGHEAPPFPQELMHQRPVDTQKLNAEIARRSSLNDVKETESIPSGELLAPEMIRFARPLLEQGRYREAAAVFEFGARQFPSNAEFKNNLGFCLVPEDAAEALDHLAAASRLGYHRREINVHNKMCCHVVMGKARAALKEADEAWERIEAQPVGSASLWRIEDGRFSLIRSPDARRSVAEYAVAIARSEGWKKEQELWRARADTLT